MLVLHLIVSNFIESCIKEFGFHHCRVINIKVKFMAMINSKLKYNPILHALI